jgi:FtsP/CotA-like multicopper oxidase with cupredoxin domain
VKKANGSITNNGEQAHGLGKQKATRVGVERALPPASRRDFTGKALTALLGIAVAALIALSLLLSQPPGASAQAGAPLALTQNLGSPPFANPSEVRYRTGEKRLRAVMVIVSGQYSIPNVGAAPLRQYRGWDPSGPAPNLKGDTIAPGPTLRARLGDMVEISFLNKVDDSIFPYSFDTNSPPGHSSFGCDQSGTPDPKTGKYLYPYNDLFPNCFHGSSTANIHFHGTHTSPDGVGDNVLVQVLPQLNQPDWAATFNKIFDSGKIPQKWADLPPDYRNKQMDMLKKHDTDAAAQAQKNKLPPPESLWQADDKMIKAGQWPQYLMGAFPNFFVIPDYSSGQYKAGQAPGTHWYHAHKHGSTSLHILNGLAGALVIESSQEGGYDHVIRRYYGWGDSYGDHEKIIVFQQFDPTQNLERPRSTGGKGIKQVLVNGLFQPTITMRPGEVQLWRLLNATEGNNAGKIGTDLFQTAGFTFKQTAMDGVQLSPGNYNNQPFLNPKAPGGQVPGGLALAGGNRADVLVQAPSKPGVYVLQSNNPGTLFFVNVAGSPVATPPGGAFPAKWPEMPKFLLDLPKPGPNDVKNPDTPVKFQWEAGRVKAAPATDNGPPPHFMINDKQFEEHGSQIDQCMPLNGLQDWVLENWTSTSHPFHIHINPFQVVKIETPSAQNKYTTYAPKENFVWQDVIALPPAVISADGKKITPGRVTIRQTYLDFTGTFVLHCHILAHEDRGMMELVRVVPASQYPAACQKAIPEHH